MGKLEGKSALITGGGSGIGRACALKLSAEGAWVMIADIREDIAKETADLVTAAGGTGLYLRCDVGSEAEIEAMTAKTIEQFGGIDILVSNAGNLTREASTKLLSKIGIGSSGSSSPEPFYVPGKPCVT